jgi:hypothetical protein
LRAVLRILFVVPFAYVAACLAAGAFIVLVVFAAEGDAVALAPESDMVELVFVILAAAVAVATFSIVPALLFILVAEILAWRSVFAYLAAGLLLGLAALVLMVPPGRAMDDAPLFLSAGAVAATVYWFFAGRSAGFGAEDKD